MNKPILIFDRMIENLNCTTLESDNTNAVFNAANQLLNKGKSKIGIVSCNSNLSTGKDRIRGYIKAIQQKNIDFNSDMILECNVIDLNSKVQMFLSNKEIDAIICTDEDSTYEVIKTLKILGKKIPEDVSIIAYIDEKVAQNLEPEITTIDPEPITTSSRLLGILKRFQLLGLNHWLDWLPVHIKVLGQEMLDS